MEHPADAPPTGGSPYCSPAGVQVNSNPEISFLSQRQGSGGLRRNPQGAGNGKRRLQARESAGDVSVLVANSLPASSLPQAVPAQTLPGEVADAPLPPTHPSSSSDSSVKIMYEELVLKSHVI